MHLQAQVDLDPTTTDLKVALELLYSDVFQRVLEEEQVKGSGWASALVAEGLEELKMA